MISTASEQIKSAARICGFDCVGIAASATPPFPGILRDWLAAGHHAGMRWMERRVKEREDPFVFVPGSQSLICVALNCYSSEPTPFPIAQYARNVDYHLLFREKLAALVKSIKDILPECLPITCCDTSPVLERAYAERAGIGWIGKSSQLISRNFGTWLLLGEVLINRELITDQPHPNMCGLCDRCMRACPTGAIEQEYVVDCRRCLSYCTIEHRGSLPESITGSMRGHLFGCDDCLQACPFNKFARETIEPRFKAGNHLSALAGLPTMDESTFEQLFCKTPFMRAGLAGMKRNFAAAMVL